MKYSTALAAKFARERKPRPQDWVIAPQRGQFVLIRITHRSKKTTTHPTSPYGELLT